jgi:Flp pilus assembly pilin Flp
MLNFIKNFKNDESGAVTVDWVVLTAAIVLLGAAVGTSVSKGATDLSTAMGTDMTKTSLAIPKPAG